MRWREVQQWVTQTRGQQIRRWCAEPVGVRYRLTRRVGRADRAGDEGGDDVGGRANQPSPAARWRCARARLLLSLLGVTGEQRAQPGFGRRDLAIEHSQNVLRWLRVVHAGEAHKLVNAA